MDSRASCNANFSSLATYCGWDPLQQATRGHDNNEVGCHRENLVRDGEGGGQNAAYNEEPMFSLPRESENWFALTGNGKANIRESRSVDGTSDFFNGFFLVRKTVKEDVTWQAIL